MLKRSYKFKTSLSPQHIVALIELRIDKPGFLGGVMADKKFIGEVNGNKFWIGERPLPIRNSFRSYFHGKILDLEDGAQKG